MEINPAGPYLLSRFGLGSPYLLVDMARGSKSTGVKINWDTANSVLYSPIKGVWPNVGIFYILLYIYFFF